MTAAGGVWRPERSALPQITEFPQFFVMPVMAPR